MQPRFKTRLSNLIVHLKIDLALPWVPTEFFPKGAPRKFAYKLGFKPFKNIFTDHPRIVGLYTETWMAPQTVLKLTHF
jgi:hypothetical protein